MFKVLLEVIILDIATALCLNISIDMFLIILTKQTLLEFVNTKLLHSFYLLWSIVRDSLEAHGEVDSNGARIVVTLLEIIARFVLCSNSISIWTGSGDPGLDLAVLKQNIEKIACKRRTFT